MAGVRDHTELDTWQLAQELAEKLRPVVDRPEFRRHEKLKTQIEEAAESAPSNIAEGFARYLPGDNSRFVRIAAASLNEVVVHLGRARARHLLSPQEHSELRRLACRARGAAACYAAYLETADPPPPRPRPRRSNPNPNPNPKNQNLEPGTRTPNLEPGTRNHDRITSRVS